MKKYFRAMLGLAVFITLITAYGFTGHSNQKKPVNPMLQGFALVELFTSEGCSSCPAAEALANTIAGENNNNVYIMSFHVDYWDRLGWKDQFSDKAYTDRQKEWAGIFKLKSIYTPQVVVNGKTEFVGSNESRLRATIKQELIKASSAVIELHTKAAGPKTVSVSCNIKNASNLILNIALVQKHAETAVKNGENQGRLLKHINIVRDLQKLAAGHETGTVLLSIPDGLAPADCKVIAFAQNNLDFAVTAVTEKEL